jgi:hypothetical protein
MITPFTTSGGDELVMYPLSSGIPRSGSNGCPRSFNRSMEPVLGNPLSGIAPPKPSIGGPVCASSACRKNAGVTTYTTSRPLTFA